MAEKKHIERELLLNALEERREKKLKEFKRDLYAEDLASVSNEVDELEAVIEIIKEDISIADVAPVKHGHWILTKRTRLVMTGKVGIKEGFRTVTKDNVNKATLILKRHITITRPKCSVCGYCGYDNSDITQYCPNCGAKMDGGEENENTEAHRKDD